MKIQNICEKKNRKVVFCINCPSVRVKNNIEWDSLFEQHICWSLDTEKEKKKTKTVFVWKFGVRIYKSTAARSNRAKKNKREIFYFWRESVKKLIVTIFFCDQVVDNGLKLRSDEPVPGCFSSASPWPTLELEWGRKLYPSSGPRSSSLMFSLPPGSDLNQNRGPITSLKEEPLGTRAWMQPSQQIK